MINFNSKLGDFWTSTISLKNTSPQAQPHMLLETVKKIYPGFIVEPSNCRWEMLEPQSSTTTDTSFMVQIPLQPNEIRIISSYQAMIRMLANKKTNKTAHFLHISSEHILLITKNTLGEWTSSISTWSHLEPNIYFPNDKKCYLLEEEMGLFEKLAKQFNFNNKAIIIDPTILTKKKHNPTILRSDSLRVLNKLQKLLVSSFITLLLSIGLTLTVVINIKQTELKKQEKRLIDLQLKQHEAQKVQSRIEELQNSLLQLNETTPIDLFGVLASLDKLCDDDDQFLAIRWSTENSSLQVDLISKDPVSLLENLNKQAEYKKIESSGIIPIENGLGFSFTLTLELAKQ